MKSEQVVRVETMSISISWFWLCKILTLREFRWWVPGKIPCRYVLHFPTDYWCFQTVMLKKALENPLDGRKVQPVDLKGNQPWILIGSTDAKAPVLWPPDRRADSLKKTRLLGKIEGRKRREQQRMKYLDNTINSMGVSLSKLWEIVKEGEAWHAAVHGSSKEL